MVYLYTEDIAELRTAILPEEVAKIKRSHVSRKFNSQIEMDMYLAKNPIDVSKGEYTAGLKLCKARTGYLSCFTYDDDIITYMEQHSGSTSGYNGNVYSNWLYIDVDMKLEPNKIYSDEELKEKALRFSTAIRPFVQALEENKIMHHQYASGRKGMHFYIPMAYIKVPDELKNRADRVNKLFANMVKKWFPSMAEFIDMAPYAINTTFRMPFTAHNKTGALKTKVIWKGTLKNPDMTKGEYEYVYVEPVIQDAFLDELIFPDFTGIQHRWELEYNEAALQLPETVEFKHDFPSPYNQKACIWNMMQANIGHGDHRNNALLRIMSFFAHDMKLAPPLVWGVLTSWNRHLFKDPMKESEIKSVFRYIDTTKYNLCKDEYTDKFCVHNNTCQFWAGKSRQHSLYDMKDVIRGVQDAALDTTPKFHLGRIFPKMDVYLEPAEGEILLIIAGAKVGKTMIALTMALRGGMPIVVFSYEIGRGNVAKTLAKMLGLDLLDPIDAIEFYERTKHIFIIDTGRVPVQDWESHVNSIELKHGIKIRAVIGDYLQIIPVRDEEKPNNPKARIVNETARMQYLAGYLPDLVKTNHWALIVPTQPTKGVDGGGRAVINPDAGKGGQAVMAMANKILTACRPYKPVDPSDTGQHDTVMSLWLAANREGASLPMYHYDYDGERRMIGELTSKEVEIVPAIEFSN